MRSAMAVLRVNRAMKTLTTTSMLSRIVLGCTYPRALDVEVKVFGIPCSHNKSLKSRFVASVYLTSLSVRSHGRIRPSPSHSSQTKSITRALRDPASGKFRAAAAASEDVNSSAHEDQGCLDVTLHVKKSTYRPLTFPRWCCRN